MSSSDPGHQTRNDRPRVDVTTYMTWFLVAVFAIPSVYVIKGGARALGSLGAPATMIAFGAAAWWLLATVYPSSGIHRGRQPMRAAVFLFLGSILVSWAAANLGQFPNELSRLADRGILLALAMSGLTLLIADGMDSLERLETLLQRFVLGGALIAVVGLLEYELHINFVGIFYDKIPLFSATKELNFARFLEETVSTTRRVAGTATHPIEYGVVLAMVLPIAAHYALVDGVRTGWRRWWKVAVIIAAELLAQSRSGLIALFVAGLVVLPAWPREVRRRVYWGIVPALLAGRLLFPGIIGTLKNLVLHFQSDPSYKLRTARYPLLFHFIRQHPIFGRGFQTFDAKQLIDARFGTGVDNQYITSLLETGIVGTLVLIGLFVTAITLLVYARRYVREPAERMLAMAIMASLAGVAVSFATWDVFSYVMATGCIFLLLGVAGAYWRVLRERALAEERESPASVVVLVS